MNFTKTKTILMKAAVDNLKNGASRWRSFYRDDLKDEFNVLNELAGSNLVICFHDQTNFIMRDISLKWRKFASHISTSCFKSFLFCGFSTSRRETFDKSENCYKKFVSF